MLFQDVDFGAVLACGGAVRPVSLCIVVVGRVRGVILTLEWWRWEVGKGVTWGSKGGRSGKEADVWRGRAACILVRRACSLRHTGVWGRGYAGKKTAWPRGAGK